MTKIGSRDGHYTIKKLTVEDKLPVEVVIPDTSAIATAAILETWDTNAATTAQTNVEFTVQPPYPMGIIVTAAAAGTAGADADPDYVLVKGYGADGSYQEENIQVASVATGTTASNRAWSYVTSVEPDDALHKSTDVNVGINPIKIGLPYPLATTDDIRIYAEGTAHATTAPYTYSKTYNTLTDAAVAVASSIRILYMSKVQD